MAGYNVQSLVEEVRRLVEGNLGVVASRQYPDPVILRYLNDAQVELSEVAGRRYHELSTATLDLVSGQWKYPVRGNIREVKIKNASGVWVPLRGRTDGDLSGHFQTGGTDLPSDSGEPGYWGYDDANRTLLLLPVPDRSAVTSLSLVYDPMPTPLTRVLNDSTTTCAVTGGTKIVLLSVSKVGLVLAGDDWGVLQTTQLDGTPLGKTYSPGTWYEIASVAEVAGPKTQLTLQDPYPATLTASKFITAQVPDMEYRLSRSGGWRLAPALYAAGTLVANNAVDDSAKRIGDGWIGKALQIVSTSIPETTVVPVTNDFWNQSNPFNVFVRR